MLNPESVWADQHKAAENERLAESIVEGMKRRERDELAKKERARKSRDEAAAALVVAETKRKRETAMWVGAIALIVAAVRSLYRRLNYDDDTE